MYSSDKQLVAKLNTDKYSDSQLVEFKVALNLPYFTDWKDYERRDGEIEINGVHYKYVKMKVAGDSVHLLCLPNTNKTLLSNAKMEYAKQINDTPSGKKQGESFAKKSGVFKEIGQIQSQLHFLSPVNVIKQHHVYLISIYDDPSIANDGQPPESIQG